MRKCVQAEDLFMPAGTAESLSLSSSRGASLRSRVEYLSAFLGLAAVLAFPTLGCARSSSQGVKLAFDPKPGPVEGVAPAEAENRAELVRQDPAAYLHKVGERCRTLKQYSVLFVRQERRGLFPSLQEAEYIRCWYRREPFAVRMKWLNTDLKYDESAYMEGKFENQLRFVTRWWIPPLMPPPYINSVDLRTPVTWGETKYAANEFGLEKMMDQTLKYLDELRHEVIIKYEGVRTLTEGGAPAHYIRLEYPAAKYKVPIQEMYVDVKTDLPVGTILRLANGEVDGLYAYSELNADVRLADEDFLLDVEGPKRSKAASASPTTQPASTQPAKLTAPATQPAKGATHSATPAARGTK